MPSITPYALILVAALAAACTTPNPENRIAACRATDWSNYGQNDGILGVPAAERTARFADCAELGYPADIAAYQTARAEALLTFCTVENGYEVGRAGRVYKNVCPPELEQSFIQGYDQGRKDRPASYRYQAYSFGYGYGFGYPYPYFGFSIGGHHRRHRGRHHRGY